MKPIKKNDRLRNKFFRWIGVCPIDDFDLFISDLFPLLDSFEKFSRETATWSKVVNNRLLIDAENNEDNKEKGMFG